MRINIKLIKKNVRLTLMLYMPIMEGWYNFRLKSISVNPKLRRKERTLKKKKK